MMHIAYSALQHVTVNQQNLVAGADITLTEPVIRYQAYQAACQKLSKEIEDIQKYMPGWMPAFR
ncbi:hypothetical protein [Mucilaginibacter sp. FT3.2]|uniref:hypothetical protein n=1 Tax=Mucilaginibacter sp. FT3.2 TaxID=2723090 RepID=UPI0016214925|nr:hypothetical protein [Mucilaginibacter sp. FT3.2]MBB6233258.1 hypothetical protein [Mucilaginibacter sp. FT3.2]